MFENVTWKIFFNFEIKFFDVQIHRNFLVHINVELANKKIVQQNILQKYIIWMLMPPKGVAKFLGHSILKAWPKLS